MNYDERLNDLLEELSFFEDWTERYEYIISLGKKLPPMEDRFRSEHNLIQGCQSRVWLGTEIVDGKMQLSADSDSVITKGLIALFIRLLSGLTPDEIVQADLSRIDETGLKEHLAPTRANALNSMTGQIKKAAVAAR